MLAHEPKSCSRTGAAGSRLQQPFPRARRMPSVKVRAHADNGRVSLASAPGLEPNAGTVWYFAFGSNMNPKVLTGRRGVKPLSSLPCSVPRFSMGFHCQGYSTVEPFDRALPLESGLQGSTTPPIGSYPNRVQSIKSRSRAQQSRWVYGHTVHGVVHLLSKDDWARVQLSEGILPPFSQVLQVGYQVIRVRCELYDGEWVCADTLSAAPAFLGDPWTSRPSLRYLDLLREGARHHGVDPDYCSLLDKQPASQLDVPLQLDAPLSQLLVRFLAF
uniref:gamma-glutamylcyclotransferase n=1 Tax=Dunaliella tertiolecta TaxID=3047 RepID=A0A7S3VR29_DUNTE|mmetsp:Transcript_5335/g.14337  ORF Transcript_5335/g.14337 Transcript_5335/m.14337 type:complete len:273 (+) Transcript_5335:151-969(+)